MSNLGLIQPQRVDFDTTQTTDWLDGLPLIGTQAPGGTLAGPANVGNGSIAVTSVAGGTAYGGHLVTVVGLVSGLAQIQVVDPFGTLTAAGFVGLPLYAGGIAFTITPGTTAFAVGDSFAMNVGSTPLDLTGLRFDLDARLDVGTSSVALSATSAGANPPSSAGA